MFSLKSPGTVFQLSNFRSFQILLTSILPVWFPLFPIHKIFTLPNELRITRITTILCPQFRRIGKIGRYSSDRIGFLLIFPIGNAIDVALKIRIDLTKCIFTHRWAANLSPKCDFISCLWETTSTLSNPLTTLIRRSC